MRFKIMYPKTPVLVMHTVYFCQSITVLFVDKTNFQNTTFSIVYRYTSNAIMATFLNLTYFKVSTNVTSDLFRCIFLNLWLFMHLPKFEKMYLKVGSAETLKITIEIRIVFQIINPHFKKKKLWLHTLEVVYMVPD